MVVCLHANQQAVITGHSLEHVACTLARRQAMAGHQGYQLMQKWQEWEHYGAQIDQ